MTAHPDLALSIEHDLFGKPVSTFPDHALSNFSPHECVAPPWTCGNEMLSSALLPLPIRLVRKAIRLPGGSPPSISFQADFYHDARRSFPYGQCDPRAGDGCRREGKMRPSRPADGCGRHRPRIVYAIFEIRRRRSKM